MECAPCMWRRTVLASVATNDAYFEHALAMAGSAVAANVTPCACVALSSAVSRPSSPLVRALRLPWSSSWRPPPDWCTQRLSGWRHAGILKTHALYHLVRRGWDVFFVDTDWRFVGNPLPLIASLGRDIVAARDQTRHMLNVGVLWVRATPETQLVARRTLNRTLVAWDQAVFTEEAGAARSSCCWTNVGTRLVHPRVTRQEKLALRGAHQECASGGGTRRAALPPPSGVKSRRMYPRWSSRSYNTLGSAFYRWKCFECDNKCTASFCPLDGANGTGAVLGTATERASNASPSIARKPPPRRARQGRGRSPLVQPAACATSDHACCSRHPRAQGCQHAKHTSGSSQ
ncbi:hypothetical protein AB1Y20_003574 [Prymnesium parvum]|uniref:Nucleotide-diphospho-sugar transferase domain-containing protein n=1 Tax=Prymnesium parvum TaxID=97485 RepID=A0AB34J716_PRYPA